MLSATYNHGFIEIARDAHAKHIVIDGHHHRARESRRHGWKDAEHVEIALPVSAWIDEVRPGFKAEFFNPDGDMICANGNVDLVQALLAGREILRNKV